MNQAIFLGVLARRGGSKWQCEACGKCWWDGGQRLLPKCPNCGLDWVDERVAAKNQMKHETTGRSDRGGSMELELVQKKTKIGGFSSKIKGLGWYHCEDGPAHRTRALENGGTEYWYRFGVMHRVGGPATLSQYEDTWYWNGEEHNLDGPARITKGSYPRKEYAIFGNYVSATKFKQITSDKKLMEQLRAIEKNGVGATPEIELAKPATKAKSSTSFLPVLAAGGGLAVAGLLFAGGRAAAVKKQQAAAVSVA